MQSIQKCGLEDCKVAKDIDIALLRSCRKDWWIEMKNVQISQELFFLLVRYFLIGQEETEPEIVKALEKKKIKNLEESIKILEKLVKGAA